MQIKKDSRKHWRYILPVVAILLVVGAAAFSLRGSGTANTTAGQAAVVQMNRPAGAPAAQDAAQSNVKIQEKYLSNGARVVQEVAHDTSTIAVRDMKEIPAVNGYKDGEEGPANPNAKIKISESLTDPIVQRFFGRIAIPTPIVSFDGLSAAEACGCLPPDTNGDVGPNHYVQWVNIKFRVWDKTGTPLTAPIAGNTLWQGFPGRCANNNNGDPIALYDPMADRWFMSQFLSNAPYGMCIAVSTSPDPTGTYNRYEYILSQVDFYDYEKYGVWPDGYYMTANVFQGDGGFHPSTIAFDRTAMLAGQTASFIEFNPGNYYGNIIPADMDGTVPPPAGSPNYMLSASSTSTNLYFFKFFADFANPGNAHIDGPEILPIAPIDPNLCNGARACIPQPGTGAKLDTIYDHAMYRFAYRNMGTYESLLTNESVDENGQDHAGIRWYEIRNPLNGATVYQQGTYAPDSDHRWMGSMAMDHQGNIGLDYTVSSTTTFPSVRYTGRLNGDPLGQMTQGEGTLVAGTGSQTSGLSRWGDYSNISVDPSDDCTFWITNEYYATTSNAGWKTRIGSFKFPGCTNGPVPTATGTPPTAVPTFTPAPPTPTACANYASTTSTGAIVPGTTDISNHCDDCTTYLPQLPFPVQLYEGSFSSAYVSSNGNIQFGNTSSSAYGNACLPVPVFTYAAIPYWDDLITNCTGCGVYTSVTGTSPNQIWNVEWRAQSLTNNPPTPANFEARFYEGSNRVDFVYGVIALNGTGATIGIQRDPGTATQFSCETQSVQNGLVITYNAPACPAATATVPQPTMTNTVIVNTPTVQPQATATTVVCTIQFTDVPPTNTFYPYIRCLACRGVISGYNDGTFKPDNLVTRGQLAKIVSNAANFQEDPGAQIFQDVPPNSTFYDFINRLTNRGYMTGYTCGSPGEPCVNNRPYFRPFANATRGQTAKIVSNAAMINDAIPATQQTFEDVPSTYTFWLYIERLSAHGAIGGYNCGGPGEPCGNPAKAYFRPGNNVTRGQSSKIVGIAFSCTGDIR